MQAKYDALTRACWLLMRQMQMTQSQKEKFEWVPISHGAGKDSNAQGQRNYHVLSDQYRGFVSLDFFKGLDNTYASGVKLRSKHLHFVPHEQHV